MSKPSIEQSKISIIFYQISFGSKDGPFRVRFLSIIRCCYFGCYWRREGTPYQGNPIPLEAQAPLRSPGEMVSYEEVLQKGSICYQGKMRDMNLVGAHGWGVGWWENVQEGNYPHAPFQRLHPWGQWGVEQY